MSHTRMMPWLLAVGFGALVLVAAGVEAGTLLVAAVAIACPLMMLLMMGGGMHTLRHRHHGAHEPADTSQAEDATTRS